MFIFSYVAMLAPSDRWADQSFSLLLGPGTDHMTGWGKDQWGSGSGSGYGGGYGGGLQRVVEEDPSHDFSQRTIPMRSSCQSGSGR